MIRKAITFCLLLSMLLTAYNGSVVLCFEGENAPEIEYDCTSHTCLNVLPNTDSSPSLNCEDCKHIPLQISGINHTNNAKIGLTPFIVPFLQSYNAIACCFNTPHQSIFCSSSGLLRTVILTI